MLLSSDLRSVTASDNVFVQGLLSDTALVHGRTIVYVLQGNPGDTSPDGGALWATDGRAAAFAAALQQWSNVANVSFVEAPTGYDGTGSTGSYDWVEKLGTLDAGTLGEHYLPAPGTGGGTFNIDSGFFTGASLSPGGLGFSTFMHETGHGLGLTHPHPDGTGGIWDAAFPGVSGEWDLGTDNLNQGVYTVMTYNDGYEEVGLPVDGTYGNETGLGAFDIAAIQYLYGANTSYHAGNDTYTLPTANAPGTGWSAIWDAGGTDTLSASGSSLNAYIDLRPATLQLEPGGGGFVSRNEGVLGGFTIANGVTVENATGGSGDDILTGNSANNVLNGGSGFDVANYSYLANGFSADLATGTVSADGTDTLVSIEGIKGGSGNDTLTASAQTSVFMQADLVVAPGVDGGTSLGNAFDLTQLFDPRTAADVTVPTIDASHMVATVEAAGRDSIDYYSVTLGSAAAGTSLVVDIDDTFAADTWVRLVDANGTELASNDDAAVSLDKGSANAADSYLTYTLPANLANGTHFTIEVGTYGQSGYFAPVASGSAYTMHVVAVPQAAGTTPNFNSMLDGGDGNDTLTGRGGNDLLLGGAGDDTLSGGAGTDRLEGGDGNDTLQGSSGADYLDGGNGSDTYILGATSGSDIVADSGTYGQDKIVSSIDLTHSIAGITYFELAAGSSATIATGNDGMNFIYGNQNDNFIYGMDGGDEIHAGAGNDNIHDGAGDDYLYGDDGNDWIYGGGGNDLIHGGAGDDVLLGENGNDALFSDGGNDRLYGGAGNDVYHVEGNNDLIFENPGEGTDEVWSDSSFYLYANVENLVLAGSGDLFGVGNELDNHLTGNGGANVLLGGAGNDSLWGGGGNDQLYGQDGADTMYGQEGIDYMVGGAGNDVMYGMQGADAIYGGDGDDILSADYQGAPNYDPYAGASLVGSTGPYQPDFATDILVGGAGNDTLYGNSGLGDYDRLYGNTGDDTYYVDTPADLVFEQPGEGNDTVYADIKGAGYYLYDNIENLILLNDTPFGVGNALDNTLIGSDAANWLLGGAGNDLLDGGKGADVLFGQAGNDTFRFEHGTGGDVIGDFTHGADKIDVHDFGFASFAALQSHFVQNGTDGAIDLGGGDFVVLQGVTMSSLDGGDFVL
jgi:Ca2+-binding RTX toxin-like protein